MKIEIPFIPKLEGYVIYSPEIQLFSSGGQYVSWKKKGKIWATIGHLKNHIRMFFFHDYFDKKLIIRKTYKHSVILNITTGEPINFTPNEFLKNVALKEKERYKDYEIVEE